jgi:choline dehydrogenase-like flavoprotein
MIDVCIVGSGAGASPVASVLAKAGYKVLVLEKGPWIKTDQFFKDENVVTRKQMYVPKIADEFHTIMRKNQAGDWIESTAGLWNGNMVGGSSNLMSGYFHRMKPVDFKLKSTYGAHEKYNTVDWPISYEELEPYFTKVETEIGVSGEVVGHIAQEPRSVPQFPYPKLSENKIVEHIDKACKELGISSFPVARAILSKPKDNRKSCYYSNYCGSYGCSSDAKGSGRAALLNDAVKTGNCEIRAHSKVFFLKTDGQGKVIEAYYHDEAGIIQKVAARIFVVAAQAVETSRLLLLSKNPEFVNGLANNSGQVGKNLLFSAGGVGSGLVNYDHYTKEEAEAFHIPGLFVNRATQQWYEINDAQFGAVPIKGGTVDFLWEHANPVSKANKLKWDGSRLVYGMELKNKMVSYFTKSQKLKFEIFVDWTPHDNCFVELDKTKKDKWGDAVAKVWLGAYEKDKQIGEYIAREASKILEKMGCESITWNISDYPSINLMAGGCRFGNDPNTSVLDKNCKAHEVENLYVTDGSFMPTGGSVTYTWTIYANAFRVADNILGVLNK